MVRAPAFLLGAIHRVIPDLIDLGVDALHPLQARAANMEAKVLARDFKQRIVFGGIDTQELLVRATPAEVKADVRRVQKLLGRRLIAVPSYEPSCPMCPRPTSRPWRRPPWKDAVSI